MALRQPSATLARTRLTLSFPDEAAADEVRSRGGSRVTVRLGDGTEVPARVTGTDGHAVQALAEFDPRSTVPVAGHDVVVAWSEINDLATVRARVDRCDGSSLDLSCEWPPTRVQRREFRRGAVDLPVWVVRTQQMNTVIGARTHDISGSGAAIRTPWTDLQVEEPVVVMLRCPDRDLVLPSVIHWSRLDNVVFGLRFERITQSDQDHLVQLVLTSEAARS